jgi:hypothetical protein
MGPFNWQKEFWRDGHRVVFSGQAFAMHCHHYNINLHKTLEDTLGTEGVELLVRSAEEANYQSLCSLLNQYDQLKTTKSKFEMASTMFQNSGLGILHFQHVTEKGGRLISPASHHVTGWLAKHGRRGTPGCHFARGWIAGALAAIYDRPLGTYLVKEIRCKMMRDAECRFQVSTHIGSGHGH